MIWFWRCVKQRLEVRECDHDNCAAKLEAYQTAVAEARTENVAST